MRRFRFPSQIWRRLGSPAPMAKKVVGDVRNLTGSYLDRIRREGFALSGADLAGWANQLSNDGKDEGALEIYEWMEKKKMTFSPSQLVHFVELMGKIKGHVDPHLHKMDPRELKNQESSKGNLETDEFAFPEENLENEDKLEKQEMENSRRCRPMTLAFKLSKENLENARPMTLEYKRTWKTLVQYT